MYALLTTRYGTVSVWGGRGLLEVEDMDVAKNWAGHHRVLRVFFSLLSVLRIVIQFFFFLIVAGQLCTPAGPILTPCEDVKGFDSSVRMVAASVWHQTRVEFDAISIDKYLF